MPPATSTNAAPTTFFAPPGRDLPEHFARRVAAIENALVLRKLVDAMPGMVLILNEHRQVVAANRAVKQTLHTSDDAVLGKRPGELVGCFWAGDGPDGCGTGRHCAMCGAVEAILESQRLDQQVVRDARVLIAAAAGAEPLDVRVTATPMSIDGDRYTVVALDDISEPKRLAVLQRVFFHDVLNTAGCLWGYARCLQKVDGESDLVGRMVQLTDQLIEEIKGQQDLVSAEAGDLQVQPEVIAVRPLLESLRDEYLKHPVAGDRKIELRDVWMGNVTTDKPLLRRVLGNMIKNALEATEPGRTVSLRCLERGDAVTFAIHNCEVMSEPVQCQIFQRSFSTKGQTGRGIGTYSMKLLGERYLGGEVSFLSQSPGGTTFMLTLATGTGRGGAASV